MGAIADLWKSERGLLAVLLVLGATALTGVGTMTIEQWLDYTKWIFGLYAGSKTVTGAIDLWTGAKRSDAVEPAPAPTPASPPTPEPAPAPAPAEAQG